MTLPTVAGEVREAALAQVDWEEWALALERFAKATSLVVSAYDVDGVRRTGPFALTKVGRLLIDGGAFEADAPAARSERALVVATLGGLRPQAETLLDELQIRALPLALGGRVAGVIVFGWVFETFGTALGCERLARHLKVGGQRLWAEARLESPVSVARMDVYEGLLSTLVASASRHADAIERLVDMERMREVFLAQVSHELRTPLAVLSNRIELLLHRPTDDPARIRTALLNMKRHVAEEVRLVEDLIDTARSRTAQLTIDPQPGSLTEVLQSALAAVVPNAEAKGVALDASVVDQGGSRPVVADRVRLQQVFWNLLSNAVKFTAQGGRIVVDVAESDTVYTVIVTDTGRGIDSEMLPRVFDVFARQRQGNQQGLGLGLSIAADLVAAHGGRIDARSPGIGKGSSFEVTLPKGAPPTQQA